MKKFLAFILSISVITACFAGCGDSSTENSVNEEVSNEYEEKTEDAEDITVADETEKVSDTHKEENTQETEKITDTTKQTEVTSKIHMEETTTVVSNMSETDKKEGTFGITVDEFVKKFNDKVPAELQNTNLKLIYAGEDKKNENVQYTYGGHFTLYIYTKNDYVFSLAVASNYYLLGLSDATAILGHAAYMLSPSLVIGDSKTADDVFNLISKVEDKSNGLILEWSIKDTKASYEVYSGKDIGTLVTILPK